MISLFSGADTTQEKKCNKSNVICLSFAVLSE